MTARLELIALDGIGEVEPGDDLAGLIADALGASGLTLADADCVVVTQKVVSKAEGRLVELTSVEPSPAARAWAERWKKDPRQVELVLRESAEIVRMADGRPDHQPYAPRLRLRERRGRRLERRRRRGCLAAPRRPGRVRARHPGRPAREDRRRARGHRQRLVRPAMAQRHRERGGRLGRNRGGA